MTAECHDPTNGQTLNRGTASHALNGAFGAGAAEPTKLAHRRGYGFDGVNDYAICSPGYSVSTGLISSFVTMQRGDLTGNPGILAWETGTSANVALFLYVSAGDTIRFYCGGSASFASIGATGVGFVKSRIVTLGGVYDGTNVLLYVNGKYCAMAGAPSAPPTTPHPIVIGSRGSLLGCMNGDIYHVGMSDFAVSPLMVEEYHIAMLQEYNQI